LDALVLGVADPRLNDARPCAPQAVDRVEGAGLAFGVVVALFGDIVFELEVVVLQRRQVEGEAGVPVLRRNDLLVTETAAVLEYAAVAVDEAAYAVPRVALLTVVETGAQPQAEQAVDQWPAGEEVGLAIIAELGVFLDGNPVADRTAPVILHLAGDDI